MTSKPKPNFILIISDQHRGDSLGIAGHPTLLTPTLDHLASTGTNFTRAYSTCPVCIPARRSILSGQFPVTHGMVGMQDNCEWFPKATLPGELSKAGYQTFFVGRHMHQFPRKKRFGFDHMVHTGDVHDDDVTKDLGGHGEDQPWSHGLGANTWTTRPWHLADDLHPSHRSVDAALHFLKRRDPSCPFFLVVSFAAPHPPFYPPAFYLERYLRTGVPTPYLGTWASSPPNSGSGVAPDSHFVNLKGEALLSARAGYYGLINHLDDQIHRLLNPATGVDNQTRDNTVVMYTSDHGEMLGDHYRFRKSAPFEGASRIPFIIQAPPQLNLKSGLSQGSPVCLEDLMPTILDLADLPIPSTVDGESLKPLLTGKCTTGKRAYLHSECVMDSQAAWHSILSEQFKYIWEADTGVEYFFDLKADPGELLNLIKETNFYFEIEKFKKQLISLLKERPEGYVLNNQLISGRSLSKTLPHVSTLSN